MKPLFVIRRYEIILVCLIFSLLLNTNVISRGSELNPKLLPVLEKFEQAQKIKVAIIPSPQLPVKPKLLHRIALTFDDGPYPDYTEKLLKILKKEKVKATFFVIGQNIENYPELLKKIAQDGHEIAGHTYTHRNLTQIPVDEVLLELDMTRKLINRIIHQNNFLFRPPGGQFNKTVIHLTKESEYKMVLWTVIPGDHSHPEPEKIYSRTIESATDGGVILLHLGIDETITALPKIIKKLKSQGYEFLTVSKLITTEKNQERLYAYLKP